MKNIQDLYSSQYTVLDRITESLVEESLKEKLSDIFNTVKDGIGKVADKIIQGAKNVFAKFKCYLIPVSTDGNLLSTVGGETCGLAYKDGMIDKGSTFVHMDKDGERLTNLKNSTREALKMYGSGNSIQYWNSLIKESQEAGRPINEVKIGSDDPQAKYNKICDDKELKDEIKYALTNPKGAPLMIWGAPGIGKTAILMQILKEYDEFKDYKLICKTLSNETPDNFTLPAYVTTENGQRAEDIPKTWLPVYKPTGDDNLDRQADEACGKGLLFVDELSRATPQVLNVILPLVNERIFNGFRLASGWRIICASNRDEDELAGQTSIGNALSNRFAHIYYEPTVHTWMNWAEKQRYISPLLMQWLSMPETEEFSGGKFFYMDPNETLEGDSSETKLMCTPRAWTNAMEELANRYHTGELEGFALLDIPEHILKRVLNKYVPAGAVDAFYGFLNIIKRIGNFDAAVEAVWKNDGKGLNISANDLRKVALPLAQMVICAHGGKKLPTESEFDSLVNWTVNSNNDQLAAYVYNIFKNVYADVLPDYLKEDMYNARFVYDNSTPQQQEALDVSMRPLLRKYGFKNCGELPNYRLSLKKVVAKYRDIFSSTTINGKVAMV